MKQQFIVLLLVILGVIRAAPVRDTPDVPQLECIKRPTGIGPPFVPEFSNFTITHAPCKENSNRMCLAFIFPAIAPGGTMVGYELCDALAFPNMNCPVNLTSINPRCFNARWEEMFCQGNFTDPTFMESCFYPPPFDLYSFTALNPCTGQLLRAQPSMTFLDNLVNTKGQKVYQKSVYKDAWTEIITYVGKILVMVMLPYSKTIAEEGYDVKPIIISEHITYKFSIVPDTDMSQYVIREVSSSLDEADHPVIVAQVVQLSNRFLKQCEAAEDSPVRFTMQIKSPPELGKYTFTMTASEPCYGYCQGTIKINCTQEAIEGSTSIPVENAHFALNMSVVSYATNSTSGTAQLSATQYVGSGTMPFETPVKAWYNDCTKMSLRIAFNTAVSAPWGIARLLLCDLNANKPCQVIVENDQEMPSDLAKQLGFQYYPKKQMQLFQFIDSVGFSIEAANVQAYPLNLRLLVVANVDADPISNSTSLHRTKPTTASLDLPLYTQKSNNEQPSDWLSHNWPFVLVAASFALVALYMGCFIGGCVVLCCCFIWKRYASRMSINDYEAVQ